MALTWDIAHASCLEDCRHNLIPCWPDEGVFRSGNCSSAAAGPSGVARAPWIAEASWIA